MKLVVDALTKFIFGIVLVGALLFIPAGSLAFANAWLFMGLLFIPMLALGVVLFIRSPELLKKRLNAKEKQGAQKGVVGITALMFVAGFALAGLDYRFAWSSVPTPVVIVASIVLLVSYALYAEVTRENAYLSRTVEVQKEQTVISTGLYGLVRHPMYLATLFMFLPLPLILGSFWGLIPIACYPVVIVVRILNEEKVLTDGLAGYAEYKIKVRYRLIPLLW